MLIRKQCCDLTGLSSRERNQLKRKLKRQASAVAAEPCAATSAPPSKRPKTDPDAAAPVSQNSPHDV